MEMQYLPPRLSPESGAVPVNGVWAVMTKLPTTAALTFRGGMDSYQLICAGLWILKYVRIMLLYLIKKRKGHADESPLHFWPPLNTLRPLELAVMDAQNHSCTGEGLLVQQSWGATYLHHVWGAVSLRGRPSWWPRLSRADPSLQAASLCMGNPSLPLKDSFPLALSYQESPGPRILIVQQSVCISGVLNTPLILLSTWAQKFAILPSTF